MNPQKAKAIALVLVSQLLAIPASIAGLCFEYFHISLHNNRFHQFDTWQDIVLYWFYLWAGWTVFGALASFWWAKKSQNNDLNP